jgi:hypothetical protein
MVSRAVRLRSLKLIQLLSRYGTTEGTEFTEKEEETLKHQLTSLWSGVCSVVPSFTY